MSSNIGDFLDSLENEETAEYLRDKFKYYFNSNNPGASNEIAIGYLKKLVDKFEDVESLRMLGEFYLTGSIVDEDYELARSYYSRAMLQGDVESIIGLAKIYYYGYGVDKDYCMALTFYKQAANMGNLDGQVYAGKMLMLGQGCQESKDEAKEYLLMAINQGSESAKTLLEELEKSNIYDWKKEELLIQEYRQKTQEELDRLVIANDMYAIYTIAKINLDRNDTNYIEYGLEMLNKSVRLGVVCGLIDLALCYINGVGVVQDIDKARKLLTYANEQGCYIASYHLGQLYEYHIYDEDNYVHALKYYQQGAKNGEKKSAERLKMFHLDVDSEIDKYKADVIKNMCINLNSLEKKIERGNTQKVSNESNQDDTDFVFDDLLINILPGFGLFDDLKSNSYDNNDVENNKEIDYKLIDKLFEIISKEPNLNDIKCEKSDVDTWEKEYSNIQDYLKYPIEKLQELVKESDPYAMYALADIYFNRNEGDFGEDRVRAFNLYAQSANRGIISAFNALGFCCDRGVFGLEYNRDKELNLYKYAACHGCVLSLMNIGDMYAMSYDEEDNVDKAIKFYKIAASFGNVKALDKLGFEYLLYYTQKENSINTFELGMHYTTEAAKKGNDNAQVRLARLLLDKQQIDDGITWLKKAQEQGNTSADYMLASLYENNESVRDYKKSFELYEKVANTGDDIAEVKLGEFYLYGKGVAVDYNKAVEYFKNAGHPDAEAYLGICYLNGYGVPKDIQKGFDLLYSSAHQYSDIANGELGLLYINGQYVKQDFKMALEYLDKIMEQKDENPKYTEARKRLNELRCPHCGEFAGKVESNSWFNKKYYCSKCNQPWE